jgi:hypothetical protein
MNQAEDSEFPAALTQMNQAEITEFPAAHPLMK